MSGPPSIPGAEKPDFKHSTSAPSNSGNWNWTRLGANHELKAPASRAKLSSATASPHKNGVQTQVDKTVTGTPPKKEISDPSSMGEGNSTIPLPVDHPAGTVEHQPPGAFEDDTPSVVDADVVENDRRNQPGRFQHENAEPADPNSVRADNDDAKGRILSGEEQAKSPNTLGLIDPPSSKGTKEHTSLENSSETTPMVQHRPSSTAQDTSTSTSHINTTKAEGDQSPKEAQSSVSSLADSDAAGTVRRRELPDVADSVSSLTDSDTKPAILDSTCTNHYVTDECSNRHCSIAEHPNMGLGNGFVKSGASRSGTNVLSGSGISTTAEEAEQSHKGKEPEERGKQDIPPVIERVSIPADLMSPPKIMIHKPSQSSVADRSAPRTIDEILADEPREPRMSSQQQRPQEVYLPSTFSMTEEQPDFTNDQSAVPPPWQEQNVITNENGAITSIIPRPTFEPHDEPTLKKHKPRKRHLFIRKTRNAAARKTILKITLGRELALPTKQALRRLAKGEDVAIEDSSVVS